MCDSVLLSSPSRSRADVCASWHRKENWAEEAKHEGAEMAATEVLTNGQLQEERFHTRFHSSVRK